VRPGPPVRALGADRVLAPFGRRAIPITAREQFGPYVVLRCADPVGPRPQAGQFYMLAAAGRWGGGASERPFLPRAFSVLRAPADSDELHFMVREGRRAVLAGGGVGIAPLAIWQDQLGLDDARVVLGFRDHDHARGATLLADPQVSTDDGSVGHRGLVTELLLDELDRDEHAEVYVCGPPPMLEAVRELCAARRVPAQLALESGMACGFGACFGCVVPTRDGYVRLCVDGPVLDAASLDAVTWPNGGAVSGTSGAEL
jgi:dihydroorotate dehydrogenase electron transfer subunit